METFDCEMNRLYYSYPGVFSVRCGVSHKIIFGESENVYQSLVEILCKLRTGSYENSELQKDFQRYGEDSFRFSPLLYGPELINKHFRDVELKRIMKNPSLRRLMSDFNL